MIAESSPMHRLAHLLAWIPRVVGSGCDSKEPIALTDKTKQEVIDCLDQFNDERDLAAVVLDDTVDHREPEAGAVARSLGGDEGLEYLVEEILGHAGAVVDDQIAQADKRGGEGLCWEPRKERRPLGRYV